MILNFSIQNFGSIKDKQTLSFEADKSDHLEDAFVVKIGKQRILKLALIYGANASGKTTILKALDFLKDLVLVPENKKTDKLDFEPFLFDPVTPIQNTILSIEFIKSKIKYSYEVEFNKDAIVSEELIFFNPKKATVYTRRTDLSAQLTKVMFGSKMKIDKAAEDGLVANTLWNNTVLGGYLKTNVDIKELQEVMNWFRYYLGPLIYPETNLQRMVTLAVNENEISKSDVLNILKRADLYVSDITFKKEEEAPDNLQQVLKANETNIDKVTYKRVDEWLNSFDIKFEHTVNKAKYLLPFGDESQGTQRYFGFAGLLALLLSKPSAFLIDELESSLHPDLYIHFLLDFLLNSNESQVIATTHNREILGEKDLFREDAIWFTDKKEDCSTELYSLADFDSSVIRNSTNILNAYKSGKLSGVPNLGDNFIEIEK